MQPVLFEVPGLDWEVQAYGFFMGLALVLGWMISLGFARRDRLPAEVLGIVYVLSVAVALFGARAIWVLQHPMAYQGWRSLLTLQAGTLAPFAGIVLALLVSGAMVTRRKIPVSLWYDAMTPAFAVGVVLERFGAFLAGSGHGKYAASFPLAVRFPMDSPVYEAHRRTLGALLPPAATDSLPVHPTQLYAVVVGLIGVALCVVLYKRRRFSGQVFMGYLAYWLVARSFVEEFFRADAATPVVGPFHGGQFGAAAVIVGLIVVYRVRSRRAAAQPGALRLWEGGAWSPPGQGPADADKRSGRHGERTSRSGKRR